MPVSEALRMAGRPDPFNWLKPRWLRQWSDRQKARDAFSGSSRLHNSRKPKLTPEEARRDHAMMLRFLALHALFGAMIGMAIAISLVVFDIGNLGRLVSRAANPAVPLILVIVPFACLFGAASAGSAILTLPYERKYRDEDESEH